MHFQSKPAVAYGVDENLTVLAGVEGDPAGGSMDSFTLHALSSASLHRCHRSTKGRSDAMELADLEQHFDGGFSSALLPFAVPLGLDAEHFRKVLGVFIVQ
jgi:hypothetical protein